MTGVTTWVLVIAFALVLSLGYRAWKYQRIKRAGYDVKWSVPIVRWLRAPRDKRPRE